MIGTKGGPARVWVGAAVVVFAWLPVWTPVVQAQDWIPERRKDQFFTEPAYLVVPFPYSLPGIGSGLAFTGLLANIAETQVDVAGVFITGDVEGDYITVEDLYVIPKTLFFEFERFRASSAIVNSYEKRGMDTEQDDFKLIELDKVDGREARAILSFFDRRLEFRGGVSYQDISIVRIRDSDGKVIADLRNDPITSSSESTFAGVVFDLTDDRHDPRTGFRLDVERSNSPREDRTEANYYVWDYSASFYIPFGKLNTLLLHAFASDAQVTSKGETDPAKVRRDLGIVCAPGDAECIAAEQELVDQYVAEHKYGTASDLGGDRRLRSYPGGRYQGAHTIFYGAEFRWNLTEEVTPFDYFVWKDVRTGMQLAFFYETGSVADKPSDLGDIYRSSYGLGFRLISASGFVYRADFATGDEGSEVSLIFDYPF